MAVARIVVVGDELLEGLRADSNGPWLAMRLADAGFRVAGLSIVGDDTAAISDAVAAAAEAADVVLVTGGLGPTCDDVTRDGLAKAAAADLVEDDGALSWLIDRLERDRVDLTEARRGQIRLPRGATWHANPEGTAPCIEMALGRAVLWALPGVPREMHAIFRSAIRPRLEAIEGRRPAVVDAVWCVGIAEADAAARLAGLSGEHDVDLAFYPHEGEVEVRVKARCPDGRASVEAVVEAARTRLGDAVCDPAPIERAVVKALRDASMTVTTAESMTGGLVAKMLTSVAGSSRVFRGGWVTYSDAWKQDALGVPADLIESEGVISEAVARAMADGARARSGADAALSVTGLAGQTDGVDPSGRPIPRGTFHLGLALDGAPTRTRTLCVSMAREAVRRRAAVALLDMLRRALLGHGQG